MNKYKSTLLSQTNDVTEIQKADLDLLKKINELSSIIEELQSQVDILIAKAG